MTVRKRNSLLIPNKWLIYTIVGFLIALFIFLFKLRDKIDEDNKHLPINSYISNKLKFSQKVSLELNDSTYSVMVDSMKELNLKMFYKLGLNRVRISINDSKPMIDDTFQIKEIHPGIVSFEIDNLNNELGFHWDVDSITLKHYYFYKAIIKQDSIKRVKFGVFGMRIE